MFTINWVVRGLGAFIVFILVRTSVVEQPVVKEDTYKTPDVIGFSDLKNLKVDFKTETKDLELENFYKCGDQYCPRLVGEIKDTQEFEIKCTKTCPEDLVMEFGGQSAKVSDNKNFITNL